MLEHRHSPIAMEVAIVTPSLNTLYPEQLIGQEQSTKICKTCLQSLPASSFDKANHGRTLHGDCKKCRYANKKRHASEKQASSPIPSSKICVRCKVEKPVEEFTRVASNSTGFHSYCKSCKRTDEWRQADKRAESKRISLKTEYENIDFNLRPKAKICGNPYCKLSGQLQPPENFDKSKIHGSKLRIYCRICELERKRNIGPIETSSEYNNRWHQEHKEELSQRTKDWRQANPEEVIRLHCQRRFRQYGVTQEWYDTTLADQGGGCAICGSTDPKNQWNTFHIDHDHSCCSKSCHACDNCRRGLLCSVCNTRLGILELTQWIVKANKYLDMFKNNNISTSCATPRSASS